MCMRNLILAGAVATGLAASTIVSVQAADLFHDPVLSAEISAPKSFDGLYAGVSLGLMNSNKMVFYPNVNGYRALAGVYGGYNKQINPWLIAGFETQLDGAYEWEANTVGYNAFALGQLGLLTREDFAVYEVAGLGLIDGKTAYAVGVQAEQKLSDTFSVRAESLSFGQLAPAGGVPNYKGIMGMKLTLGAHWYLRSGTESFAEASPFSQTLTRFAGPYLGLYAGGAYNPSSNFFGGDAFYGWHITRFVQGGIAGWNYDLGSMFRAGGEIQAGINYNTSGNIGVDAQALARIGIVPFDGLMVYATGGVGLLEAQPAYTLGGGIENALWGKNTLRLDVQVLGEINPGPFINKSGFSALKFSLGTLWHFD